MLTSMIEKYSEKIRDFADRSMFGVLSTLGERMGIATSKIRLFFVYITFLGFGSPIFIYLALAFVINIGRYIRSRRRNPVWDF